MGRIVDVHDVMDTYKKVCPGKTLSDFMLAWLLQKTPDAKSNGWIDCEKSMPGNAHHPGETCIRLLVLSKKLGPTEGWYNPDHHCWYGLVWLMTGEYPIEKDIDMVRGDIPCVVKNLDVIAWKPYPEGKEQE